MNKNLLGIRILTVSKYLPTDYLLQRKKFDRFFLNQVINPFKSPIMKYTDVIWFLI